jgi:putative ABC transport system permease protein
MFPTATLVDAPISYIAAFRAPAQPGFDNALAREFPNITSIDVSASIAQIQSRARPGGARVEFLFGFTLAAGLVGPFRCGDGDAGGAIARVRHHAGARRERAAAGAVQRAELLWCRRARRRARLGRRDYRRLGRWRRYASSSPGMRRRGCRRAGGVTGALLALGAGLVGPAGVCAGPVVETLRQAADV